MGLAKTNLFKEITKMKMTVVEVMEIINGNANVKATVDATNVCFKRFNGMSAKIIGFTDDKTKKAIVIIEDKEYRINVKDLDITVIEEKKTNDIKISVNTASNGQEYARIWTPYNEHFVYGIKQIEEAKWLDKAYCWSVPIKYIDRVRELLNICYGRDDLTKVA